MPFIGLNEGFEGTITIEWQVRELGIDARLPAVGGILHDKHHPRRLSLAYQDKTKLLLGRGQCFCIRRK